MTGALPRKGFILPFSILLYTAALTWLALHGPLGSGGLPFQLAYGFAYLGMLGIWKYYPVRFGLLLMITIGLFTRAAMLFYFPASDDVFRYLWEGHIQGFGGNPFLTAPNAEILVPLRTPYFNSINHPHIPTLYFPFAQWMFRGISALGETPFLIKTMVTVFDLGGAGILWLIIQKLNIKPRHFALYFLNPLLILFTSGEGHIEILMVFWILLAVLSLLIKKPAIMYLALGLAVMTNIKTLFLLPFFIYKKECRYLPVIFIPGLLSIPYLDPGFSFLSIPFRFATEFHFNGAAYSLFSVLFHPHISALMCGLFFLGILSLLILISANPITSIFQAIVAFLIFSPTVHPWYLLLLTPWLVLFPSPVWKTWHLSIAAVFPIYSHFWITGEWKGSGFPIVLEYLSLFLVYFGRKTKLVGIREQAHAVSPGSVSIIIPVYNEAQNIRECIEYVKKTTTDVKMQIVVVDGGSTDGTLDEVAKFPEITLIHGNLGRGIQVKKGLDQATGEVILILHADSRLNPDSIERMRIALSQNLAIIGGSFGAQYSDSSFKFWILEGLNNFRARNLGIAYGDQAQFFRREKMVGLFPPFLLMEDIELSMRLKEIGPVLFIPKGVRCSTRRWKKKGYFQNSFKVIWLTLLYLGRRRLGFVELDGARYYRKYYQK